MKRTRFAGSRRYRIVILAAALGAIGLGRTVFTQGQAPQYRVQPFWPQPFADQSWVFGSISGVAVDAQNHVWVVHRGNASLEANERGMTANPPTSSVCCQAAPFVLEFDQTGKLLSSWGGPGAGYSWPQVPGNIAVDSRGGVWIAGYGSEPAAGGARGLRGRGRGAAPPAPPDAHVLKFGRDGKFLLQIGEPGKMDGPDSRTTLNRPSAIAFDAAANEVFIADAGNRRIAVFDADNGTYKRHWFAYGEKAAGEAPPAYKPGETPARSFRDLTCVEISRDGLVYVCDRSSNRIQVFGKDGSFVREGLLARDTLGSTVTAGGGLLSAGSVWDLAFSSDAEQRFLFVADGHNKKVRIVQRNNLTEVGGFGAGGRYPGLFLAVNSIAVDAQGNVYTGEAHHGKRVQKFEPAR